MPSTKNMFKHINGLPNIPELNYFELLYDDKKLYLNSLKLGIFKNEILKSFEIPLQKIVDIDYITEEYMQDKSVIKRAIIGSFINPLGAIIGGMSGIGQKKAKKQLYSITFLASDDTIKNVVFDPQYMSYDIKNMGFNKKINKQLKDIQKDPKIEKILNEGFDFTEDENSVNRTEL
nr:MAG TPA: hypothetical protein [Caudoviricetes sp.]